MCTDFLKKLFHCNKGKSELAISCQKIQIVRNRGVSVEVLQSSRDAVIMYVKPKSQKEYYVDNTKLYLFECDNKDKEPMYFLLDSSDENAIALSNNLSGFSNVRIEGMFYDCYYNIEGQDVQVLTTSEFAE